jgi:hypothetical protein
LRVGAGRTEDLDRPVAEVDRMNAFRPQLELAVIRPIPDSGCRQNRNHTAGYQTDPVVHRLHPLESRPEIPGSFLSPTAENGLARPTKIKKLPTSTDA